MPYCSFSGRTVKDGDEFCANCARHLFLDMSKRESTESRRILCPKCRGRSLIDGSDGKKIICDYPGCENGRVRVDE